jgi:hypothetical protein
MNSMVRLLLYMTFILLRTYLFRRNHLTTTSANVVMRLRYIAMLCVKSGREKYAQKRVTEEEKKTKMVDAQY